MKRIHIDMVCDEGHAADELRHLANYMDEAETLDEYDFDNATAIVEKYEDDLEKTLNKTPKEILAFHRNVYLPTESIMREMCRKYISRILMDTDEEHPMELDITVEPEWACGMSSLEMPHIDAAWQDPGSGCIYFNEDSCPARDIDYYSIHELIQIVDQL